MAQPADTPNDPLAIDRYDYPLPDDRIARYPLPERDQSLLLVYNPQAGCRQGHFVELPHFLPAGAQLVFNNTRVAPVRLFFRNHTGANIEVFCLEPAHGQPMAEALALPGPQDWRALVGNRKRWKLEQPLTASLREPFDLQLSVYYGEPTADAHRLRLSWTPAKLSLGEVFELLGNAPLPPYLKRPAEASDRERYQTVYAQETGAVAAPTAGLHFTPRVLQALSAAQVQSLQLTLHVGAGTFRPVKAGHALDHLMHAERFALSRAALRQLAESPGPVVAVGTTALRTLESLYVLGVGVLAGQPLLNADGEVEVAQWAWRSWEPHALPTRSQALAALVQAAEAAGLNQLSGHTQLMVAPGYPFGVVDGLITNFHQPRSTLLLLIAAFIGQEWRQVYNYALDNNFRFLSYGDSSLLWRNPHTPASSS